MFKFRMIGPILKAAGLGHATIAFLVVFAVCACVVAVAEPSLDGHGDVLWYCFQAVTTIGYGDVVATSVVARFATAVLSIVSIFYLAVVTGSVVAVCSEMIKLRNNASIAELQYKLEHLPDLSPEELAEVSEKIRNIKL